MSGSEELMPSDSVSNSGFPLFALLQICKAGLRNHMQEINIKIEKKKENEKRRNKEMRQKAGGEKKGRK